MRFVIYDDETMEPITVIAVPGVGERDIERLPGQTLRVAPIPELRFTSDEAPRRHKLDIVEIRFERFIRKGTISWMAFTREADLALLLAPDFLPGQRREVNRLREDIDALVDMMLRAFNGT